MSQNHAVKKRILKIEELVLNGGKSRLLKTSELEHDDLQICKLCEAVHEGSKSTQCLIQQKL